MIMNLLFSFNISSSVINVKLFIFAILSIKIRWFIYACISWLGDEN